MFYLLSCTVWLRSLLSPKKQLSSCGLLSLCLYKLDVVLGTISRSSPDSTAQLLVRVFVGKTWLLVRNSMYGQNHVGIKCPTSSIGEMFL